MHIQMNTDNTLPGSEPLMKAAESLVRERLSRFASRITRVEVHLSDVNGDRGGDDKRCVMEARPEGMEPLAVTHQAGSMDSATSGAANKMIAILDRTFGKIDAKSRR